MYDLAVIGGGPAGTSAAITAAGYGASVLLLEKGSFPRHKVCGEFVSAESLEILASLLSDGKGLMEAAPRIHRARMFLEGRVLEMPIEPPSASIARFDLDNALWHSAKCRGIDARERQNVSETEGKGPFAIRTADGEFMSRSIVDASGRWSNLNSSQQRYRNPDGSAKWIGVKAQYREDNPSDSVDLYFFEGGYCGVQPIISGGEGRINACAMVRSDTATTIQEVLLQHAELEKRSRQWQQVTEPTATSPLRFRTPEPLHGNILRAGDAAAFVDPFVGDGISLALRGGTLAARALSLFLQGHGSLEQAGEGYQRAYCREFMRVYSTSSNIRYLLGFPSPVRRGILSLLTAFPALTRYMVRKTR